MITIDKSSKILGKCDSLHPNKKPDMLEAFEGFRTGGVYDNIDFVRRDIDMYLSWRDIDLEVDVKAPNQPPFCYKKTTLNLIKSNSGFVKSGECLAIMGGSGAGKSTLINIIADRFNSTKNMRYRRDVRINDEPLVWDKFQSVTGFVMQKTKFFSDQKVREVLEFNAKLKFGNLDKEQINKKVESVIGFLKLEQAKETLVGGLFRKAISGGEHKRLTIGAEIIRDPKILFLDEPTSGLDSYTSFLIVQRLRILARELNMIILYTIHQPSISAYHLFDNLMILNEGKTVYFGSATALTDYYERSGIPRMGYKPPAEMLISAAMKGNPIVDSQFFQDNRIQSETALNNVNEIMPDIEMDKEIDRPSFFNQVGILIKRNFLNYVRNPITFHVRISQTLFLSIIACLMYGGMAKLDLANPVTLNNRLGAYYFSGCIVYVGYFLITSLICKLISPSRTRNFYPRVQRRLL